MAVTALPVKTTTPHHHLYTTLPLVTEHKVPPSNKNSACHCEIKMPFSLHLGITLTRGVFVFISLPDFKSCLAFAMSVTTL